MKIMQKFPLVFEQKKSFFYWSLEKYIAIIGFQFQNKCQIKYSCYQTGLKFL